MRIIFFTTVLTILFSTNLYSQYRKFDNPIWTIGTANTVSTKDLHLNALYFSQYGITNKLELQTKPLWYLKMPNLTIKKKWFCKKPKPAKNFFEKTGIIVTTKHGIFYPTPFLNWNKARTLTKLKNLNSIASPIISTKNEILISFVINKNKGCYKKTNIFTLKAGFHKSFLNPSDDLLLNINSLYYRQTASVAGYNVLNIGFDIDSKFNYGLNYAFDAEIYMLDFSLRNTIFEHKGIFYWYMGKKHRLRPALGYQFSFTNFPGINSGLTPLFDISFLFKINRRSKNNNLFDNGVLDDTDMDNLYKDDD